MNSAWSYNWWGVTCTCVLHCSVIGKLQLAWWQCRWGWYCRCDKIWPGTPCIHRPRGALLQTEISSTSLESGSFVTGTQGDDEPGNDEENNRLQTLWYVTNIVCLMIVIWYGCCVVCVTIWVIMESVWWLLITWCLFGTNLGTKVTWNKHGGSWWLGVCLATGHLQSMMLQ